MDVALVIDRPSREGVGGIVGPGELRGLIHDWQLGQMMVFGRHSEKYEYHDEKQSNKKRELSVHFDRAFSASQHLEHLVHNSHSVHSEKGPGTRREQIEVATKTTLISAIIT